MRYSIRLDTIYFTKTENWKDCDKIIFKCVNSIVGSIFNEKIVKKMRFVGLITKNLLKICVQGTEKLIKIIFKRWKVD